MKKLSAFRRLLVHIFSGLAKGEKKQGKEKKRNPPCSHLFVLFHCSLVARLYKQDVSVMFTLPGVWVAALGHPHNCTIMGKQYGKGKGPIKKQSKVRGGAERDDIRGKWNDSRQDSEALLILKGPA